MNLRAVIHISVIISQKRPRGRFCREHAMDGMDNVISPRCDFEGCDSRPSYNFPGETSGKFCSIHLAKGMIDVIHSLCENPVCRKRSHYNFSGESRGRFCRSHAEEGMIIVTIRLCDSQDCTKQPNKGFPGNSATRCTEHKLPGMISHPRSRCTFRDDSGNKCQELALYGITRAMHCETHRETDEINLIEQTCVSCGLITVVDSHGVCGYCDPTNQVRTHLAKQRTVQAFLDRKIDSEENPEYDSYDRQLDGGICGRERPDFLWDCGGWYVVLEVDEDQHDSRQDSCETIRMKNISQSLGGPKVWFLRYNPDVYRTNGRKYNPRQKTRHKTLLRNLKFCLSTNPPETVFITARYLYYNGYSEPAICDVTIEAMAESA